MRWLREIRECARVGATVVGLLAVGCAPRLMAVVDDAPALVLTPIDAPAVRDGRARFREMLCTLASERAASADSGWTCSSLLWRMAGEPEASAAPAPLPDLDPRLRVLIVPGAFAECFPEFGMPFEDAALSFRKRGGRVDFIPVSGRGGCDRNAAMIAAELEVIPFDPYERIVLIGHSKGAADILHFLVNHPDAARRIRAVVSVAGAVNGSPLADALADGLGGLLTGLPFRHCPPDDRQVLACLTRSYRMKWLASHRLPAHVKYFSLAGFAVREEIQPMMLFTYDLLAAVEPKNDGYLAFYDQLIPGGTLLGYAALDHWDIALPVRERMNLGGAGSRAAARELLFEAIVAAVTESLASVDD